MRPAGTIGGAGRLDRVREFADNLLAHARPEGSPLFMDRLDGDARCRDFSRLSGAGGEFALSNLADQQCLMRMLVGLTGLTGDDRYRTAALDSVRFVLQQFADPAGLLAWGGHVAITLPMRDVAVETAKRPRHELKCVYPFYELMWQADAMATRKCIEAFWNAHVSDWQRLDFSRHGRYQVKIGALWESEYDPGPVFFWGQGLTFSRTGSDLYYAAAMHTHLSGAPKPLVWAKRLARRYVETRQPGVGISGYQYSQCADSECNGREIRGDRAQYQYAPYLPEGHLIYESTIFRPYPAVQRSQMHLAETLRGLGDEFSDWASEELAAWARVAYRARDNVFLPMLTDGYSLEGFVIRKDGYFGPRGRVEEGRFAGADFFWAYAQAYRLTKDEIFWAMARSIARANGLGDIGEQPGAGVSLEPASEVCDHRFVHGLLEVFKATGDPSYLRCAEAIADAIIARGFREGWFLAEHGRSANRPEALAILRLVAVESGREQDVPAAIV